MDDFKLLCDLQWKWQFDLLLAELADQQIEVEYKIKAREYASIITGLGAETYKVYVNHNDFIKAGEILQKLFNLAP